MYRPVDVIIINIFGGLELNYSNFLPFVTNLPAVNGSNA